MTPASILHAACLKIINMWSCVLSAWSASRLFRSFSMQYVRALAYVRVERFHSALPTHTDVSFSNHILQTIAMADSIIQNGEAYGGLGTCRSSYLSPCWCERYVMMRRSAFIFFFLQRDAPAKFQCSVYAHFPLLVGVPRAAFVDCYMDATLRLCSQERHGCENVFSAVLVAYTKAR